MNNQNQYLTIRELVQKAIQYISELGYSAVRINFYSMIWRHLLKHASKHNVELFSMEFGMEF